MPAQTLSELEQRADNSPDDFAIIPGVIQNMEVVQNPTKCVVEGMVPSWLRGDIVRTGPGQFKHGKDVYHAWFDGEAILMKFSITEDGGVYYQSRFINSQVRQDHLKHKCIIHGGLGNPSIQDPCQSVFSKFFTQFWHRPKNDNTNVNILQLGDSSYATTDVSISWKFDLDTLSTETGFNLMDEVPIPTTTGHPHYDTNGDYLNVGNLVGRESFYTILKIPNEKMSLPDPIRETEIFAKVPVTNSLKPSYHHSFSITENYIIVHEQSLKMDVLKILHPFAWKDGMGKCFGVEEGFEFKFHVVDKRTGELLTTKYCTKPQMCFHTINAWEESSVNGKKFIVIDLCAADDCYEMFELIKFSNMLQAPEEMTHIKNYPQRFVLPLLDDDDDSSTSVGNAKIGSDLNKDFDTESNACMRDDGFIYITSESLITDELREIIPGSIDLPRFNSEFNTKRYRYGYYVGAKAAVPSVIIKIDHDTKEYKIWDEEGMYASEPVFVPSPEPTSEDDGVILSNVVSSDPNQLPFLLILDAKTFKELARAEIDAKLSYCFHAHFFSKGQTSP